MHLKQWAAQAGNQSEFVQDTQENAGSQHIYFTATHTSLLHGWQTKLILMDFFVSLDAGYCEHLDFFFFILDSHCVSHRARQN